jgi:MFS family permease
MLRVNGLPVPGQLGRDFWIFFAGQAVSAFGTAFTTFALPLLVYRLTGSPVDLAATSAATFLPVVLFGLIIGAWTDRGDRKRLMILSDLGRAVVVASLPVMSSIGLLSFGWIVMAAFVSSIFWVVFETGQASAVASIVRKEHLPTANGWQQASYAIASSLGLAASGFAATSVPLQTLMLIDAASFIISALCLASIAGNFSVKQRAETNGVTRSTLWTDLRDGVRYVMHDRGLLGLALTCTVLNLVGTTATVQLVVLAKESMMASDAELGVLLAGGSLGVVLLSLAAGPLLLRMSFTTMIVATLVTRGAATLGLGTATSMLMAAPLWALEAGSAGLFNVVTLSAVQSTVPAHVLGRVVSILRALALSSIPIGALIGGYVIEITQRVATVYIGIGAFIVLLGFAYTLVPHVRDRPVSAAAEAG